MRDEFNKLIPQLAEEQNGEGIDIETWIERVGTFEHAIGYAQLFWPNFEGYQDCVFFAGFNKENYHHWLEEYDGNKEAVQRMMNSISIFDFFPHVPQQPSREQVTYLGEKLKEIWKAKLQRDFPDQEIIVRFPAKKYDDLRMYEITFYANKVELTDEGEDEHYQGYEKIDRTEYDRYLLIKNYTEDLFLAEIKENGVIFVGEEDYQQLRFKVAQNKEWVVVLVDETIDFYTYYGLIGWFTNRDDFTPKPEFSFGFAKHKTDIQQNYLCYLDPDIHVGDTLCGTFQNGNCFTVYLPEAYYENGNLKLDHFEEYNISMQETIQVIREEGLDPNLLNLLKYNNHFIEINLKDEE